MLHPENETRLPSLRVHDFAEHIKAVMRSVATRSREEADYSEWRARQTWIAGQDNRIVVPYALPLVDLIPPVDIRINRDVESLLNAIQAHAILHQATHERNADGEIVATLDYFDAVHGLVGGVVSAAVATRVPPQLRTIVSALKMLLDDDTKSTQFALRDKTGFSRSQVGHWLRARAT